MLEPEKGATVRYLSIAGFPGYHVGDDGTVWSRWRRRGPYVELGEAWSRLALYTNDDGYQAVNMVNDGHRVCMYVHALVLSTFIGPPPLGMEGCHDNGDRGDNRLSNLRWDTPKANAADRDRHRRTARGQRNGSAKINDEIVLEVLQLLGEGQTQTSIAARFGLSQTHVWRIKEGRSWKHLTQPAKEVT